MKKNIVPLFFTTALLLTACGGKEYSPQDYIAKTLDYRDGFKILQLTDIHMSDKDDQDLHYAFLDKLIKEAKEDPDHTGMVDFMVVTGDLFTFASKSTAKRLFKFLDSYDIPWTVVFGNHDEQTYFSVDWMTSYLNKFGSNCVFKDIQNDNVQGNCNFAVNLKNADGTLHNQLIFMDSNRYYFGSYMGYDRFNTNQINWYANLIDYTNQQDFLAGGTGDVKSLMFYHIPLPEIDLICDKETMKPGDEGYNFIYGEKREKSCPPDQDYGFFDTIKSLGSTTAMFFGHDHINNFEANYEGVKFCYGIKSTDRIYYADDMLGYQTISINNDNSLSINRYYHTYAEVM